MTVRKINHFEVFYCSDTFMICTLLFPEKKLQVQCCLNSQTLHVFSIVLITECIGIRHSVFS